MTTQQLKELQEIIHQCMQDTTIRFAGIDLLQEETALSDNVCTVHTTLEADATPRWYYAPTPRC